MRSTADGGAGGEVTHGGALSCGALRGGMSLRYCSAPSSPLPPRCARLPPPLSRWRMKARERCRSRAASFCERYGGGPRSGRVANSEWGKESRLRRSLLPSSSCWPFSLFAIRYSLLAIRYSPKQKKGNGTPTDAFPQPAVLLGTAAHPSMDAHAYRRPTAALPWGLSIPRCQPQAMLPGTWVLAPLP